jgi:hypothetical protein
LTSREGQAVLIRLLVLGVCALTAAAALAQDQPRSGDGRPDDDVPRLDELLPPSQKRELPQERRDSAPQGRESRGEMRPSDRWGAVAYTADGAFGAAYGVETKEVAERLAVDECRRESTDKNDCSRGVLAGQDRWFHIQFCQRGNDAYAHVTSARTLAEVNQQAAQYAAQSKYGAENCRMVPNGLLHSGGLHTRM